MQAQFWNYLRNCEEQIEISGYFYHFTPKANLNSIIINNCLDYNKKVEYGCKNAFSQGLAINFAYSPDIKHSITSLPSDLKNRQYNNFVCILFKTETIPFCCYEDEIAWKDPVIFEDYCIIENNNDIDNIISLLNK